MSKVSKDCFFHHFSEIEDFRRWNFVHNLFDVIVISVCAVISGASGWKHIEEYGKSKKEFLETFLELPNGVPSDDTYRRVMSALNPEVFRQCFLGWIDGLIKDVGGDIISIDGKTLRHSFNTADETKAIHIVSAWSNQHQIVLGQVKTNEKSNEITAIPELLKLLDISGSIVTIDAMGTQKKIAEQIVDGKGDYVLALKGNHQTLYDEVILYFDGIKEGKIIPDKKAEFEVFDGEHGRSEARKYIQTTDINWIEDRTLWKGFKSIGFVESTREIKGKVSKEIRCYISSLDLGIETFAKAVRSHWGIENSLHWTLDVSFREDDCRIRKDHAPENFAILRHISLNLLKIEKSLKAGINIKRYKAALDDGYMLKVLSGKNT